MIDRMIVLLALAVWMYDGLSSEVYKPHEVFLQEGESFTYAYRGIAGG
jgi:hypothetical protein